MTDNFDNTQIIKKWIVITFITALAIIIGIFINQYINNKTSSYTGVFYKLGLNNEKPCEITGHGLLCSNVFYFNKVTDSKSDHPTKISHVIVSGFDKYPKDAEIDDMKGTECKLKDEDKIEYKVLECRHIIGINKSKNEPGEIKIDYPYSE